MPKPVSLTVHRNTRTRRHRHDLNRLLHEQVRYATRRKDWDGFVVVLIRHNKRDGDFTTLAGYHAPDVLPVLMLPTMVAEALRERLSRDAIGTGLEPPPDESA